MAPVAYVRPIRQDSQPAGPRLLLVADRQPPHTEGVLIQRFITTTNAIPTNASPRIIAMIVR